MLGHDLKLNFVIVGRIYLLYPYKTYILSILYVL